MLKLRKLSWHARLYLQAYADDREWLDHPVTGGEWREKSAKKAVAVRARLDNGFMSICPYFWKTMYALAVYIFVARPWYATRNFLRANWRPTLVVLAAQVAITLIAGAWWVRGDIVALPEKIVAKWQADQAEAEARDKINAKYDGMWREQQEYLRRHPEVAAKVKARLEAWDKELEAKSAEELAELKAGLAKAAPWLIGISLAVTLLFAFTPLLNLLLAAFVLFIIIPLERTRLGRMLLDAFAVVFWWFLELPGRIWRAAKTFLRDTWQFLRGYVMTVKEHVCPLITFVDGHPTS